MLVEKKISRNTCKFFRPLAYLCFECGVVVELVTTLACHAGGRGFKSPPSRHFLNLLVIFSLFPLNTYSLPSPKKEKVSNSQVIRIVAEEDPTYSFSETGEDKNPSPPDKNSSHSDKNSSPADKSASHSEKKPSHSDKKSNYLGADFEIIQKAFARIERERVLIDKSAPPLKYTLENVPYEELESLLASGEADIVLGIQKSKKLLSIADFPRTPMRIKNFVFYGRKEDVAPGKTVMTYNDVLTHNYIVGINIGFLYPREFWKYFPYQDFQLNNHLRELSSYKANVKHLSKKTIDLFVANRDKMSFILSKMEEAEEVFQYKNILYYKEYYCALSKKSKIKNRDDVLRKIQRALYKMYETDELNDIVKDWMSKKVP